MKNLEIAKILNRIADILELQDVPWKPQAYRKAALSIESLPEDIEAVCRRGELQEISGVGKAIAEKIEEFIRTGKLKYYDELRKKVQVDVEHLGAIPFLGPKKIKSLYQNLKIKTVEDLEKAVRQKKVRELPGFGEETEKKISEGIKYLRSSPQRFLYGQAAPIVKEIKERMGALASVKKIEIAGSFRRGKETVGDLDFLAVSSRPEEVMKFFKEMPDVKEVLAKGATKSSIRLGSGLQIDLRVVKEEEFGSAMNYFIGSKEHNIELRKFALGKGYTLNEYGLFELKGKKRVAGRTEEEIYQKLGLQFIEPELREDKGEIQAALKKSLPKLVTNKDIKGVFHNHSQWSDGNNTLLEMAQQAESLGFKFISFNDHFGPIGITHPLREKDLAKYLQEIRKVQKKVGLKVFSGLEVDILKDGRLPLSKEKLKGFDVVAVSVHLAGGMEEAEMTKRVCFALENYPVNILAHPTNRLLNERKPLALNLETVFEVASKNKIFLEINAQPQRIDLNGQQVKAAKDKGCHFALSTDAHDQNHLKNYVYGVLSARRGWVEKKDMLNCWSLPKIEKVLGK